VRAAAQKSNARYARSEAASVARTAALDNVHIEEYDLLDCRHHKAFSPPHKLAGTRLSCPLVRLEASRAKGHPHEEKQGLV
jgi:hypothetical protein